MPCASFRLWLKQQTTRLDSIGNLARAATRDPGWQGDTTDSLQQRMQQRKQLFAAFDAATREYDAHAIPAELPVPAQHTHSHAQD